MLIVSKCIDRLKFRMFENAINRSTWTEHDRILAWAEAAAQQAELWEAEELYEASDDPIVRQGHVLRKQVLHHFRGKYSDLDGIRVLIHTPPPNISPGGFSLFNNLAQAIGYQGVPVQQLNWDKPIRDVLADFKPTFLLTSDSSDYLNQLDWVAIRDHKQQHGLHLGLTASLQEYGNTPLHERLAWAGQHDVDFYYSFRTPEYLTERKEYQPFFDEEYPIFSVEFGANPLLYYPVPGIQRDLDYVFLASANRDKWLRYFEYLTEIMGTHQGFLDGPGWRKIHNYNFNPHKDRYVYARSKIGLNLHLTEQIEYPCELNERTYMLAACGVAQLIDRPLLLTKRFSRDCFFIAETASQYKDLFEHMLKSGDDCMKASMKAQKEVFEKHTTFHRAESFIQQLIKYLGA